MLAVDALFKDQIDILKKRSKDIRRALNLTQKNVEEQLGYTNGFISCMETHKGDWHKGADYKNTARNSLWIAYYFWLAANYPTLELWQQEFLKSIFGPTITYWQPPKEGWVYHVY